jgi:threonine/homoserine/homoserine lactone efflux protein
LPSTSATVGIRGLLTGLLLQLAIGPVFFLILAISAQRTFADGLLAVLAVTSVDYLYICLAILGVGKLFEKKKAKHLFGMVGAVVLAILGAVMVVSTMHAASAGVPSATSTSTYASSFVSAFVLTISSPLTILFWTSLFTAKAVEYGYTKKELTHFGLSAGLATPVFLGLSVTLLSIVRQSIPPVLIRMLNAAVGTMLVVYGILRLINAMKKAQGE